MLLCGVFGRCEGGESCFESGCVVVGEGEESAPAGEEMREGEPDAGGGASYGDDYTFH